MKGERCSIQLPELRQFYVLSSQELLKRLQGILIMYPPELGNSDTEFVFFFFSQSPLEGIHETEAWFGKLTDSRAKQGIWKSFKQSFPDQAHLDLTVINSLILSGSLEASLNGSKKCLLE